MVAAVRGVKRAQFALAWLRSKPAVTAALVGASTVGQIDDAIASLVLVIDLRSDEIRLGVLHHRVLLQGNIGVAADIGESNGDILLL